MPRPMSQQPARNTEPPYQQGDCKRQEINLHFDPFFMIFDHSIEWSMPVCSMTSTPTDSRPRGKP